MKQILLKISENVTVQQKVHIGHHMHHQLKVKKSRFFIKKIFFKVRKHINMEKLSLNSGLNTILEKAKEDKNENKSKEIGNSKDNTVSTL